MFGNDRWPWYNFRSSDIVCFVYGGVVKTFRCLPQTIEMLDAFNALKLWDFWLHSFGTSSAGDDVLEIRAGTDYPTRYASLRFYNVAYLSCPTMFHHAQVRLATDLEIGTVRKLAEFEAQLFAIDTDVGDSDARTYFVAASSVDAELPEA